MSKQIGVKMVEINGEMVECKVYSTRKVAGANTFNQKMRVRGKDALTQRAKRKTDMRTTDYIPPAENKLQKRHQGSRINRDNLVYHAGDID